MKLIDLEPEFATYIERDGRRFIGHPETLAEAQGIAFLCPACFLKNGGSVGTHSILVWFKDRGVPAQADPVARWGVTGTGFSDLTLTPSINSKDDWHGFIANGEIK